MDNDQKVNFIYLLNPLKMEAASISETLAPIHQSTQWRISEHGIILTIPNLVHKIGFTPPSLCRDLTELVSLEAVWSTQSGKLLAVVSHLTDTSLPAVF